MSEEKSKAIELVAQWTESDGECDPYVFGMNAVNELRRQDAEIVALKAQLGQGEPVAYRHTLHMELGQTQVGFGLKPHHTDIFGHAGDNYDPSYHVTVEPLYIAPQPSKSVLDKCELLPLPDPTMSKTWPHNKTLIDLFSGDQMQQYARAVLNQIRKLKVGD